MTHIKTFVITSPGVLNPSMGVKTTARKRDVILTHSICSQTGRKIAERREKEGKRLLPDRREQPGGSMKEGGQFQ
jgi:hypothetical protein